ncbi:hypothetical protein SESBI_39301 [Sesbania bispinosa]|nr:hypothetical protein SESBI_39301 [Sesbania bispinosa]
MSIFGSNSNQSDSSSCLELARTLKNSQKIRAPHVVHPAWSMSSLMTALPESPSPICSHASTTYTQSQTRTYYSDNATEFSTPRNQNSGIDNNNCSSCFSDIDEWLEHANKFCSSNNYHLTETVDSRQNGRTEEDTRILAICNTFLTVPEDELCNITLPSVREGSPVFHGQTTLISSNYGAFKSGSNERRRLMCRPKPYDEFLNEVRRKKLEAERNARTKAKHVELMRRMRRKEEAINDWELWQTRKAMDEMDKTQA